MTEPRTLDAGEGGNERGRTVDIHALRHTCGTRHARQRRPLQNTQKLLGHSDPKLTASTYSHIEGDDLREDVESLPSLEPVRQNDAPAKAAGAEGTHIPGSNLAPGASAQDPANDGGALSADPSDEKDGARGENRTRNPCFTKAVLYR